MGIRPIHPNARLALNQMKYEIARELGMESDDLTSENTGLNSVQNIFFAGNVGGHMTKRLVEIGEKQLINKNE